MTRILISSSSRSPGFETTTLAEQFERERYSLAAIYYNLEQRGGYEIRKAGFATTHNIFKLARLIDTFKPHIVYSYGSLTALAPLRARRFLCRWKNFKVVHGWDDAYGDIWNDLFGWPGRVFMDRVEKMIVTRSDGVVTLSRFLQARGKSWGVDCHYIPNGADPVDRTRTAPGKIRLDGRFNIVYTGDQAKWKRTRDVCAAMRRVPKDIKLYLTGRHYAYLDEYASENCVFLGFLPKEEQLAVMSQADCFVCTADQDCNAKIQEYLRWERPYLGYDGRANLFFRNRHNALLTRDYAAAITELADNPALCAELARHAKAEIPIYSWAEIAAQFAAYFEGLLNGADDRAGKTPR